MHDPALVLPVSTFVREYPAGDTLFYEGDGGDALFLIVSGAVLLTKSLGGETKSQGVRGPGDFVGKEAVLSRHPHACTARVVEATRCLVIEARVILALSLRAAALRERTEGGVRIRMTLDEIARELGVDVGVARQVLEELRHLGLIAEEPGALFVAELSVLVELLDR